MLIVAFAVAAGGSYSLLRFIDDGTDDVLASDEQLVPAQIGDLITTVSTDGSLVFPISETVVFESSGVIGEVLVAEGDIVTEGQILATLDPASVAGLEKAVVQAQLDLYEAQESLAEATADPDSLDIASAEATIEEALVSLQQAQDDRDALGAEPPDSSELAAAASSLANAALAIQDAEDLLADLTSGPDTDAIADAEEDIAAAMTALANAEGSYAMVYGEENEAVTEARVDLDAALEAYTQLFVAWLGVDPSLVDPATAPADHLAAWEIDLDALFDIAKAPDLASRFLTPPDDPATVWHEPTIHFYIAFLPGGIVGTCDDSSPPPTYTCVLLDFNAAWDAVEEERVNVDAITLDASKAIASADSTVASAQDSLEAAQEALADLMVVADPLRVAAAEADLVLAREKFDDAKAALAELTNPEEPDGVAIAKADAAIVRANINVEKAREALADLAPDPTPLALALLEADVTAAEFALEAAVTALDGTTLLAPIGGEVISVEIEPGNNATRGEQAANQQTEGILITDRNIVEIEGTVDEIDILAIDVDVTAEVTLAALPGEIAQRLRDRDRVADQPARGRLVPRQRAAGGPRRPLLGRGAHGHGVNRHERGTGRPLGADGGGPGQFRATVHPGIQRRGGGRTARGARRQRRLLGRRAFGHRGGRAGRHARARVRAGVRDLRGRLRRRERVARPPGRRRPQGAQLMAARGSRRGGSPCR